MWQSVPQTPGEWLSECLDALNTQNYRKPRLRGCQSDSDAVEKGPTFDKHLVVADFGDGHTAHFKVAGLQII